MHTPPDAFVLYSRRYPRASIRHALIRNGFYPREHAPADWRPEGSWAPVLVVLALDPETEPIRNLITEVRVAGAALVVVLVPGADRGVIMALRAGADLCLRDHDATNLMAAQIEAVLRRVRTAEQPPASSDDTNNRLVIDLPRRHVSRGLMSIHVTHNEFSLLVRLAREVGEPVSLVTLMESLGYSDPDPVHASNLVKVHVSRLKAKLGAPAAPGREYIRTIRGFGYRLEEDLIRVELP